MKRSEHVTKAASFRALLAVESVKPPGEQSWPDETSWLTVEGVATCTTPHCPVSGRAFPVTLRENADGVYRVQCGHCLRPIVPSLSLEEG